MSAWTVVVPFESGIQITRDPDVVSWWIGVAANDIDDALLDAVHGDGSSTERAMSDSAGNVKKGPDEYADTSIAERHFVSSICVVVRLRSLRELRRDSLRILSRSRSAS